MNTEAKVWSVAVILGFWVAGLLFGMIRQDTLTRREAIKANAAHYEAGANGDPVFKWGGRAP